MKSASSLEQYCVPIFCSVNIFKEIVEQEKEERERRVKNHNHAKAHLFGAMSNGPR
ncbi:MAG TPA: hypothetical protein VJ729_10925 [Nitrososphaeraceae archaeon]|nr:hypothetical protein [Nitrososphaeraceae archaeon]